MLPPLDQFEANIGQVREMVTMAAVLDAQTTAAIRVDDIYRAAFVLAVSALDHYAHEKVLTEMLRVAQGSRQQTDSFRKFRISLDALGAQLNAPPNVWLEQEVRRAHSVLTFQRADAISEAIRLVHPQPLWPAIGDRMSRDVREIKSTLDLIVDRRNKIAHEADCEPNGLGIKWPITEALVTYTIEFLVRIVRSIDSVV